MQYKSISLHNKNEEVVLIASRKIEILDLFSGIDRGFRLGLEMADIMCRHCEIDKLLTKAIGNARTKESDCW